MMENFEKCLKIKERLGELRGKAAGLEADIRKDEREHDLLSQASMSDPEKKAAVDALLAGRDPGELKVKLTETKSKIEGLKKELVETQAGVDLLKVELETTESGAISELREKFMDSYLKAVRAFHKKAKEAEKLEAEFWEIKQGAQDMASQACSRTHSPLPALLRVLLAEVAEPAINGTLPRFEKDCERQGVDLG